VNSVDRPARVIGAILALAVLAGCTAEAPPPPAGTPGAAALRLFSLAGEEDRSAEFETIFDPDALADRRVALLDALDSLAASPAPQLTGVSAPEGADEAFADLSVELPGGGRAFYSVMLLASPAGTWRIAWFQGPGVEWPRRGRRGDGLTTSVPPGNGRDG